MRPHRIDDVKVIAPNASFLCGGSRLVKRGYFFTFGFLDGTMHMARSLGRVTPTEKYPDDKCDSYVLGMCLSYDASFCFIRWVDPADIRAVYAETPTKLPAFFFAPKLPYDPYTMERLIDYGTVCERYIDSAGKRVEDWMFEDAVREAKAFGNPG